MSSTIIVIVVVVIIMILVSLCDLYRRGGKSKSGSGGDKYWDGESLSDGGEGGCDFGGGDDGGGGGDCGGGDGGGD